MGRFYKTAQPEFIDNFIYQPPWQLMDQVMATKQQGYDNAIAQTELFKNLDIRHRDTEEENQNVKEIKEYWNAKADEIARKIKEDQDPDSYLKYTEDLKQLGRQLKSDYTEGNISKIQGTYDNFQGYLKKIEKVKETDPQRAAALLKEADDKWKGNSLQTGIWNQEDMYDTPDFAKYIKEASDRIKANIEKHGVEYFNGLNITKKVNSIKEITPLMLEQAAYLDFAQDPANKAYAKQVQRLGLGKYDVPMFENRYRDTTTGKVLNEDNYNKLSEEEKKKYTQGQVPNSEHALFNYISNAGLGAYKEWETDQDTKANPGATTQYTEAQDTARNNARISAENKRFFDKLGLDREKFDWEKYKYNNEAQKADINKLDTVINNPNIDPKLKEDAIRQKNQILGVPDFMAFKGQELGLSGDNKANPMQIKDAIDRANFGAGLKSIMSKNVEAFANGKLTQDKFIKQSVIEYYKTDAGKKEFYDIELKQKVGVNPHVGRGGTYYEYTRNRSKAEVDKLYNDYINGKGGVNVGKYKEFKEAIIPKIETQLKKYNADVQQDGLSLTSTQKQTVNSLVAQTPDAFTYYGEDGKPIKIKGNFDSNIVGAGTKGNSTRVIQGTADGKTVYAVPNDSYRTTGSILALKEATKNWAGENTPLGVKFRNDDMTIRQNVLNSMIRSNKDGREWYSPVIKDPAGSKYGLQGQASGSTKTGVGGFYVYKPSKDGNFSPKDKINDTPLSIEEVTILINKLNKIE